LGRTSPNNVDVQVLLRTRSLPATVTFARKRPCRVQGSKGQPLMFMFEKQVGERPNIRGKVPRAQMTMGLQGHKVL
jgi:hypothetical protein